jgi:hypothetical protein
MQNNLSPVATQVMQSLQNFTESDDAPVSLEPTYVPRGLFVGEDIVVRPGVKTGKAAQQSFADLWKRQQKHPDEERFLPVQSRAARRAQQATQRKARVRGQRDWRRRERLKEIATSDLANLFNIADGHVPARPRVRALAVERLEARVQDLRGERDPAEVWAELRMLAKTARTVAPKVKTSA